MSQPNTPDTPATAGPHAPLPTITTDLGKDEILRRLDAAARRGRLPDYHPGGASLFTLAAFGGPFDYRLIADSHNSSETTLTFRLAIARRSPAITLAVLALTIWPGVWLTDSMLRTYFTSYHSATWMWYLPITVLPLPWMWLSMIRKSRAAANESARKLIEQVRAEIGGVARQDAAPLT